MDSNCNSFRRHEWLANRSTQSKTVPNLCLSTGDASARVPYPPSVFMHQNLNFGMSFLISIAALPPEACIHSACLSGRPRGTATSDAKSAYYSLACCSPSYETTRRSTDGTPYPALFFFYGYCLFKMVHLLTATTSLTHPVHPRYPNLVLPRPNPSHQTDT